MIFRTPQKEVRKNVPYGSVLCDASYWPPGVTLALFAMGRWVVGGELFLLTKGPLTLCPDS